MGEEDLTGTKYIDDLNELWPLGSDNPVKGDNHIRGIKNVLVDSFGAIAGAVTSTHTELNLIDGSIAGTAVASKALVLGASKDVDTIDVTTLELGGVEVTSTAAELNYNDITAAGTAEASKALVLDASKDLTGIRNLTLSDTDAGSTASPDFTLYRDSASPANTDNLGIIYFNGESNGDTERTYGWIRAKIVSQADGAEEGHVDISTIQAGVVVQAAYIENGLVIGSATGGDKGFGTINTKNDIYKNNSAYTNPDYVFEYAFTGAIEKYKDNPGASKYKGMRSIDEIERIANETYRLPGFSDKPMGAFERSDILLEKLEEAYLLIFELNKRIKALE